MNISRVGVCLGILCVAMGQLSLMSQTNDKELDAALRLLGFKPDQKAAVLKGEVLSNDPKESTDKELAVAIVALMPGKLDKVVSMVREAKFLESDPEILQFGQISSPPKVEDLQKLQFSGKELEELSGLLKAAPGSDYNLSKEEIAGFEKLRKELGRANPEKDPAAAKAVLDAYRQMLVARCLAYEKGGLKGIAPYQRKGSDVASPSEELGKALSSENLEGPNISAFLKGMANYPNDLPPQTESSLMWLKQKVSDRSCVILAHRLIKEQKDLALMSQRQIYVGNNYNALQVLVGCVQVDNGVVVFYRNRTSTDQVAGFGSGMRHKIGRGMMRDEILKKFENIRAVLKKAQ